MKQLGLSNAMTIMYVMIESGRQQASEGEGDSIRQAIGRRITIESCIVANTRYSQPLWSLTYYTF